MILALLLLVILLGVLPLGFFLFRSLNQAKEESMETLDADLLGHKKIPTTQSWWEVHRGKFNWSLLFAGLVAFLLNAIILPIIVADIPQFGLQGGIFQFLIQSLAYLIYIGVANVFFTLGPLMENIFNPKDLAQFRKNTFNLLRAFFVIIPQAIILLLFF